MKCLGVCGWACLGVFGADKCTFLFCINIASVYSYTVSNNYVVSAQGCQLWSLQPQFLLQKILQVNNQGPSMASVLICRNTHLYSAMYPYRQCNSCITTCICYICTIGRPKQQRPTARGSPNIVRRDPYQPPSTLDQDAKVTGKYQQHNYKQQIAT